MSRNADLAPPRFFDSTLLETVCVELDEEDILVTPWEAVIR